MNNLMLALFLLFAQNEHDTIPNPYEACCGAQPVEHFVGVAKVFVPNVFTPNGDAVNDLFLPMLSKEIAQVTDFVITNPAADTIFFRAENRALSEGVAAWDGSTPTGKTHRGAFKYQMTLHNKDGARLTIEGTACSVLCDSAALILKRNPTCFYPAQADPFGSLDASQPTYENKRCFSN